MCKLDRGLNKGKGEAAPKRRKNLLEKHKTKKGRIYRLSVIDHIMKRETNAGNR